MDSEEIRRKVEEFSRESVELLKLNDEYETRAYFRRKIEETSKYKWFD